MVIDMSSSMKLCDALSEKIKKWIDFSAMLKIIPDKTINGKKYDLKTIEKQIEMCDMMGNELGTYKTIQEQIVVHNNKDYSIEEFMAIVNY